MDARDEKNALIAAIVIAVILQLPLFWFIAQQTRMEKRRVSVRHATSPLIGMLIPQKKKLKKKEPIPKGQVVDLPEEIKTKQNTKEKSEEWPSLHLYGKCRSECGKEKTGKI